MSAMSTASIAGVVMLSLSLILMVGGFLHDAVTGWSWDNKFRSYYQGAVLGLALAGTIIAIAGAFLS